MSESAVSSGTRVRMIPATMQRYAATRPLTATLRIAAYARVSTDEEEQQTSYEAQVDYYTKKIKENPEWVFVEVYADEGITGTSTKRRKNFNRMIEDAMAGKIDRIITKSVSRFARNTVDTLTTIRMLKEKGVGVTFEKENIDTLDSKGELLITIMSSLAQEESRSISENVTWGWRKRISDGKVAVAYSHFLGYEKGTGDKANQLRIVEDEAQIVREIYALFLDGQTPSSIAVILTKRGVPTPAGKAKWTNSTVRSILTNEKYKGDSLLQKTFKPDFLSKTQKNCGEVPQFYVENSHPAVVSAEVFDLAQYEMMRRGQKGRHTSAVSVFSNRLVCGECGAYFGSKVWHSNDPYRCVVWRCNRKYEKGTARCTTPHVREEEIKAAFQKAISQVLEHKNEIFAAYEGIIANLTDTDKLTQESYRLQAELDRLYLELNQMVHRNAEMAQDQDEYNRAFDALTAKCESLKGQQRKINDQLAEKADRKRKMDAFMEKIKETEELTAFDEHLFNSFQSKNQRKEVRNMNYEQIAAKAAAWAVGKVGCAYSQARRTQEKIFDCSSLIARAYSAQGKQWRYGGAIPCSNQEVYDDEFELLWPETYDTIGKKMGGLRAIALGNRAGDLQFLCTDSGTSRVNRITHVAMVASKSQIVHARGSAYGVCTNAISLYSGKVCAVARYNPSCTLRSGMRGFRTLRLQQALNALGSSLITDGEYGSATAGAVKAYQAAQGISATGEADPTTLALLHQLPVADDSPASGGGNVGRIQVTGATVNLRSGPGSEYPSIHIAQKGEEYETIDTNQWVPIRLNEEICWISGKYSRTA